MNKKDVVDYKNSLKSWIFDNVYVDGDFKVRNNFHITGKYRGSRHEDFNIKVK